MARATTLAALAAAVLAVSTLTACVPTFGGSPSAGRCRVKFTSPYRPRITNGALIRGDASALCTGPVDEHHVTLSLERNSGASWQTVDQDVSNAIPYPSAVALTVIVECRPGTWRLRYDVRAVAQGQTASRSDGSDDLTVSSFQDCKVPR